MDTNIIQSVKDKKFSEFETAVKQELKNKLANSPEVKKYASDYDKIQSLKDTFAKINTPEVPDEPAKPADPVVDNNDNNEPGTPDNNEE